MSHGWAADGKTHPASVDAHNDICELLDNLPDEEKYDILNMIDERYGRGEDGRRRGFDKSKWPGQRKASRDAEPPNLEVRGAERPSGEPAMDRALDRLGDAISRRVYATDAQPAAAADAFLARYPDAARIKASVWG
jgi:hypothetical protein